MKIYKIAQNIEEAKRHNLSTITPEQWRKINNRMVDLGYDFRGGEDTKKIYERLNNTPGGLLEDHTKVLNAIFYNKEYIKKYSPQKTMGTFQKAIKYFGLTNNLKEAGYILPNGQMLNFSGSTWGGTSNTRALDHSEINDIINMPEFISMGAIRHFPEQPGVDIRTKPTPQQLNVIWRDVELSNNGYVVEINKGRFYKQYDENVKPEKIMYDIKTFYKTL